jgi:anti-sigma regulatory factor (Ser/Thr protein kinase)
MAELGAGRLELLADPNAVSQARAWLKARLGDWSPDGVATVQLLVSELVTNAILHTADVVEVIAERAGSLITVEVADRNPSKPVVKRYERDAATGRGLHLVEALADAWGVRGDDTHKSVWFRVIDGAPSRRTVPSADETSSGEADSWSDPGHRLAHSPAAAPPGVAGGPAVSVCLSGLPVAVYLEVEEHHDALVRELGMLLRSHDDAAEPKTGDRLIELAARLVDQFGVGNEQRRSQVEAARQAGQETVDVVMLFPSGAHAQVSKIADELDEIDEYCDRGELLTPPSTATVKRFRRWYTDEIVRQLQGLTPTPWST